MKPRQTRLFLLRVRGIDLTVAKLIVRASRSNSLSAAGHGSLVVLASLRATSAPPFDSPHSLKI